VLFLADRIALVKQAKDSFHNYLPDMSLCNLLSNKDDKNARIVFSTYPTILNAIDSQKNERGLRLFTPAHFDLIILDEAHRSIFRKYRAIFAYFDACLMGLTATPKTDVDRNTYDFFEMEAGVPTYAYEYETAVNADHVLVPYFNIEVRSKFLEEGIAYDDLSEEDKRRYEEDFTDEDGEMPDFIPSPQLNQYIFNQQTVDMVIEDLMTKGIKTADGEKIGKTIVFAQNKNHAQYIVERFDSLYPQYKGRFAKRVVCDDAYAQTLIEDFKQPEKAPQIAVSVDMMDTGLDVPEVLNLVFFKKVRSRTKFWQMIGRGTRLCKNLECLDSKDGVYTDKRRFYIFDYVGNFEFFRARREGIEGHEIHSLSEAIFIKRIKLIHTFQESAFAGREYQTWRGNLVETVLAQIRALNMELVSVRSKIRYVERYKEEMAFVCLTEQDKHDLSQNLAALVYMEDADEDAKRFDNFMYGLILARLENSPVFRKLKNQLCNLCKSLEKRVTIPQIKEKLPLIQSVISDEFWVTADPLILENVREELRGLIKFLSDGESRPIIFTNLTDEVIGIKEGNPLDPPENFEDYREKVNLYIRTLRDHIAIYKLCNNIRLEQGDYQSLSDILTRELGNAEDYRQAYQDLPFGLLVRKIAKMEREAAMQVFSEFINDQTLNQEQIVFVNKIVDYVVQNGYIESPTVLMQAPFDKPKSFIKLFDDDKQKKIVELFEEIKDNAVNVGS
jgi:type I restriction enzyme R subunit